ncbi:universal stress protein [Paenibacillus sp. JX-17]|uniref:Universal stress protein n=1 Tax=Paenibacillus lacisoli TaxID=3064525 RepID=A0ABT9CI97_9BACL|nr:universal stress protein [Paenibacillus sp. JX-17]MDO7908288.1 universal stress protein [Paenibacillus sp. JX-17]
MFKHILVAVDGSEHSMHALNTAKTLAVSLQGETAMTVLHVNPSIAMNEPPVGVDVDDRIEEEGRHILEPAADLLAGSGITYEMAAAHGNPAEVICQAAREKNADLIIMGTRGHSLVKEMLLGSVSHSVIAHAPCPVLTVK